MKCSECLGKGFIEYEAGQIMVRCEACKGTGERADKPKALVLSERMGDGETFEELVDKAHKIIEGSREYEPIRRTNSDDSDIRSPVASESPKPRKRKTRKKATKRAGQILQVA